MPFACVCASLHEKQTNSTAGPPGTGVGPAPPLPARPGSQSGSGSYNYYAGGPASGSGTPSAGPINLTSAFNTVERFTGKDTRQQLEKGVDGLVRGEWIASGRVYLEKG
jgi:hypothetical protein